MDFAFFAIAFNIKKMCAKLIKEGKGLITVGKYMFMGLFITRYNWNIATCCQMHEEKVGQCKNLRGNICKNPIFA
jgi:hypothetical protein